MIGTTIEVNIDLVMAALSALVTQETDGDEDKQEQLRHSQNFSIDIIMPTTNDLGVAPLVIRGFDNYRKLFEVTDDREKWRTWANELGLRMP